MTVGEVWLLGNISSCLGTEACLGLCLSEGQITGFRDRTTLQVTCGKEDCITCVHSQEVGWVHDSFSNK